MEEATRSNVLRNREVSVVYFAAEPLGWRASGTVREGLTCC